MATGAERLVSVSQLLEAGHPLSHAVLDLDHLAVALLDQNARPAVGRVHPQLAPPLRRFDREHQLSALTVLAGAHVDTRDDRRAAVGSEQLAELDYAPFEPVGPLIEPVGTADVPDRTELVGALPKIMNGGVEGAPLLCGLARLRLGFVVDRFEGVRFLRAGRIRQRWRRSGPQQSETQHSQPSGNTHGDLLR
ncbi:MAG: hypothetical protein ACYTFT_13675 [Planctomycetota bacterium]